MQYLRDIVLKLKSRQLKKVSCLLLVLSYSRTQNSTADDGTINYNSG